MRAFSCLQGSPRGWTYRAQCGTMVATIGNEPMTTLYNLHTDGDQYRVTKFVDGNPEGSYLVSHVECQCPAGHRPSCRHRQMLPLMLSHNLLNAPWFWDFDRQRAADFNGHSRPEPLPLHQRRCLGCFRIDCPDFPACMPIDDTPAIEGVTVVDVSDPAALHNAIAEVVGEPTTQPASWRRI